MMLRPFHLACVSLVIAFGTNPEGATAQSSISPTEAVEIATDAYVYGYSLITTEVTRTQMANVPRGLSRANEPI
jgi:hypothetical protein